MMEFFSALGEHAFLRHAIAAGLLAAVGCGVVGTYVVVRRIGYLAGGIAHAVLGGMGVAYFFGKAPFAGAVVAAIIAALLIGWASLRDDARDDVLISAIWVGGMSIGLLFISQAPGYSPDLQSYLFGNILLVDRRSLYLMAALDVVVVGCVLALYKQMLAVSFDEEFARLRGLSTNFYYLLLLCMVALTVVLLIPVVGVVLILALLTLPAAIAMHFSSSMGVIMILATLVGAIVTSSGLALSYGPDLPPGASIALLASLVYMVTLFCSSALRRRLAAKQALLILPFAVIVGTQELRASFVPEDFSITQITSGVYVHEGAIAGIESSQRGDSANLAFVVGDKCIAVIDSGGALATGEKLIGAIRSVSDKPICHVINTHVHFDHVLGNAAFTESKSFVGHVNLVEAIGANADFFAENFAPEMAGSKLVAPTTTVSETLTLDLGGRELKLRAWPRGHTSQDVTVVDSKTNTVFLGDLVFRGRVPALDGSINGWIKILDELRGQSYAHAVPGHGKVSDDWPAMSDANYEYLKTVRDEARAGIADGMFLEDAMETVGRSLADKWALFDEVHARNVTRAFKELEWE